MSKPGNAMKADTSLASISPRELFERWRDGAAVEIIDVRSRADFVAAHVPSARSVPYEVLEPETLLAQRRQGNDEPLYVICQIGRQSARACARFVETGFTNVVNVGGGTRAWQRAGLPIVSESGVSTARQVQVIAGGMVLIGTALGATFRPLFALLAALAGADLLIAGVTGSCALRMLVASLPWNHQRLDRRLVQPWLTSDGRPAIASHSEPRPGGDATSSGDVG